MVIQRWQSVFLLITAVLMACFSFLSLGQVQLPSQSLNFTTMGFTIEGEATGGAASGYYAHTWSFFAVAVLSFVLPLINIFLFKNMKLQKSVCLIEIFVLLAVLAIGCIYGYYNNFGGEVSWSSLIVSLPLAFFANILAYNRISADQRLLRSADRIR